MGDAVLTVLHALIDASFRTGGLTDVATTDLHAQLDAAAQPGQPVGEPEPETPAETPAVPPVSGQETNPYA